MRIPTLHPAPAKMRRERKSAGLRSGWPGNFAAPACAIGRYEFKDDGASETPALRGSDEASLA